MVKLYSDEAGHRAIRSIPVIVISNVARVEVPAALWRKHRLGELSAEAARVLVDEFEADFFGDDSTSSRFAVIGITEEILETAARVVAIHPLRSFDAVQLASALAAHAADSDCTDFACFDNALREAAAAEGLVTFP